MTSWNNRLNRLRLASLVGLTLLCVQQPSRAQSADPAPKAGESEESPETTESAAPAKPVPLTPPIDPAARDAAKKNAETLYKAGRDFWKKGQWASALLQYEASSRAFPTWAARTGMGACLVKLQRYDESLDTFESALREFGDKLPAKTKASALEQVDIMRRETGAFMVTGAAPGAMVFVDGRLRGDHPLLAPVPTLVGRHWVRVYKEGFVLYEHDVAILKGGMETLAVTLTALPNAGRLKVGEVAGRKMEVVVDGVPVGITPWEGPVSPGPHSVALRPVTQKNDPRLGTCDTSETTQVLPDAADPIAAEMGTEPMTVVVKEGQTTPLQLKAEQLGAVVRIVPDPADAEVYIDGVLVGRGPYMGRAKPGKHVVKTKADGYLTITREVDAKTSEETTPPLRLEKDVNAPRWAVAGRVVLEARGSLPLTSSVGSDLDALCTASCQQSLGTGVNATFRAGYEFPNGFGVGGTIGYFQLKQSHVGFGATIGIDEGSRDADNKVVLAPHEGTANDSTLFQNFMIGAHGSYKLGTRFPIRLGLGAGLMYGQVTYDRVGTFQDRAVGPLEQTGYFPWIYVEPEARIGIRITEGLSIGVTISGLVLIAPKVPVWTQLMQVNAHSSNPDQLGQFDSEKVTGAAFFVMNQGLYVQYGF